MAKTKLTIGITESGVHFYAMPLGVKNSITDSFTEIKNTYFDDAYFELFKQAVTKYANENRANVTAADVAVVLPDSVVSTDMIELPMVRGLKPQGMVNTTIKSLYKNLSDLKVNNTQLGIVKQTASYSVVLTRAETVEKIKKSCAAAKVNVSAVTFASSAASNAAIAINSKLKNASFLLLDIKPQSANYVFVNKGRAVGFYSLPFGAEILSDSKVSQENLLFRHNVAELAVINAQERAKSKKFTMEAAPADEADNFGEDDLNSSADFETAGVGVNAAQFGSLPRSAAKKAPKFLQRPQPENELDFLYENFRIFQKWALNLIRSNEAIVAAGKPEAVYVNVEGDYSLLFDRVNAEKDENGIVFNKLDVRGERERVYNNLELYGAFFTSQFNRNNNF